MMITIGLIFLCQGFWYSLHLARNVKFYRRYWYGYLGFIGLFILCYICCLSIAFFYPSFINLFYGSLLLAGGIYVDLSCYLGYITMQKIKYADELAHEYEYLRYHAEHDDLTGCYSRNYFFKIYETRFKQIKTEGGNVIILFIDLDRFKPINDNLGHITGDKVLTMVGNVLTDRFRKTDIVARFGGDEFIILMEKVTVQNALEIAATISDEIKILAKKIDKRIDLGCSIGINRLDEDASSAEETIKLADDACYSAKKSGEPVALSLTLIKTIPFPKVKLTAKENQIQ